MLMNLVMIVVVTTLVMAPFVAWILFKEYLARRRFIASIVGPDLGCDLSAEFQAVFKKISRWGGIPYMVVACDEPGVVLPLARVEGPTMTLDVSFRAVSGMHWEGSALVFRARFGKDTALIRVPLRSVVALCSKQTETGVIFRENLVNWEDEFQGQALRKELSGTGELKSPRKACPVVKPSEQMAIWSERDEATDIWECGPRWRESRK